MVPLPKVPCSNILLSVACARRPDREKSAACFCQFKVMDALVSWSWIVRRRIARSGPCWERSTKNVGPFATDAVPLKEVPVCLLPGQMGINKGKGSLDHQRGWKLEVLKNPIKGLSA